MAIISRMFTESIVCCPSCGLIPSEHAENQKEIAEVSVSPPPLPLETARMPTEGCDP